MMDMDNKTILNIMEESLNNTSLIDIYNQTKEQEERGPLFYVNIVFTNKTDEHSTGCNIESNSNSESFDNVFLVTELITMVKRNTQFDEYINIRVTVDDNIDNEDKYSVYIHINDTVSLCINESKSSVKGRLWLVDYVKEALKLAKVYHDPK